MDVIFVSRPEREAKIMYVRLVPGMYLNHDGTVSEVPEGTEPPPYLVVRGDVYEALERAILSNAGLADELRSHLFDVETMRDELLSIVKADNETLRTIAERPNS